MAEGLRSLVRFGDARPLRKGLVGSVEVGRRGVEMVVSRVRGRASAVCEDCHGFSSKGVVRSEVEARKGSEVFELRRLGVWGRELGPSDVW